VADLTQDEAIDRARAIEVESYDILLDLTAGPVLSRTEVRFRWRQPGVSTFAALRTQTVRSATLDVVTLPSPQDGRLPLSRAGDRDQAVTGSHSAARRWMTWSPAGPGPAGRIWSAGHRSGCGPRGTPRSGWTEPTR